MAWRGLTSVGYRFVNFATPSGYSKLGTVVLRENGYINVTIETYLLRQNPKAFRMSPDPRNSVLILAKTVINNHKLL